MIAVLCATCAGMTIVLSRSVNGYLAQKVGAYQSTFFNYFTGLFMSLVFLIILGFSHVQNFQSTVLLENPVMFIGGIIGVFNILILNIVVPKVSPVKLTLITFVSQLISGIILDYCFYNLFSVNKLIGCLIVVVGLFLYQITGES